MSKRFIRYDLCEATVQRMRTELLRMNHVRPVVTFGWETGYEKARLELAKRVCHARPTYFASSRRRCQKVLDTIDQLFLAEG